MITRAKGIFAAVALVAGSPSFAAEFIDIDGASGGYGNVNVTCGGVAAPCAFSNTFSFVTPAGYELVSASISSLMTGTNEATNIDFSSVTLNGVAFNVLSTGIQEFRNILNQTVSNGDTNTITVTGFSGGNASYTGNLSFAEAVTSVPESSTWAMMIIGLGAVGGSLRLRRTRKPALAA